MQSRLMYIHTLHSQCCFHQQREGIDGVHPQPITRILEKCDTVTAVLYEQPWDGKGLQNGNFCLPAGEV